MSDMPVCAQELVPQVMFMLSRKRRTDFCSSERCGSRSVVRMLEVCLFLALACSCSATSESDRTIAQFAHTAWGSKDGAPSPVTALAQTPDGYLWIGSPDGLYRFDGIVFERYQPPSGSPLPVHTVSSLLALPNGDLWIGYSSGGISLLRQGNATNYTAREGVPNGVIWRFVKDREGTIWAATSGGLTRLQSDRWKEVGEDWGFPGKSASTVFLDGQGILWVSTEDTLVFLPPGAKRFQPTGVRVGPVMQIAQTTSGKLWMAETTRSVRPIPRSDRRQPSDEAEVKVGSQGILFDNDGALWITSRGDGLRRSLAPELLQGPVKEFGNEVESFTTRDGLSDDDVSSILQDREGNIWVGTNNGLDRFRKTNLVPVFFPFRLHQPVWVAGDAGDVWVQAPGAMVWLHGGRTDHSLPFPNDAAVSVYRDPSGAIWWFGWHAIYRNNAGNYTTLALPPSFPKPYVPAGIRAAQDGSGALWLAAAREGLFYRKKEVWHRLDTASEFTKLTPGTAFTDWMGRVWFGYEDGTIILVKDENIQKVFPANESPVGSVRALTGRGKHIWVGGGLGLAFFDGNHFRQIMPADAETFGSIAGVVETSDGSLWLAERRGAIEIAATEIQRVLSDPSYRVKYRIFDSFDGLPGKFAGASNSKPIQETGSKLWLVASKGIVSVDPANISTNALPPPVLIRSVRADGKEPGLLKNLVLPPRTTDLQISYTALNLSAPERVRFRYRLEEVDKDWQDAGTRREAFYTRLGPGKYHFRVIACNNDGVWNEEGARLDFNIAPAWYQTIWFRGLYLLAFFTMLWGIYQARIHQLQQQEEKFRDAVETMPALAFVTDPRGNRTFFNKGWLEYTGLSSEQASGSGWEKAVHPDDLKRVTERWRQSQTTGEPLDYEARLRRGSDGVYRWFQSRARPLRDPRGRIVKWCAVANDIEDRKRAEQLQADLAHTNRVSMLGELAASISHELKQPISATVMDAQASLRWLNRDEPDLDQVRRATAAIVKDGRRAADIIDRLRSFYKKTPPQREPVDVSEIIGEMVSLLRSQASEHAVSIRTDLAAGFPKITADRVQIQQVLMNLMLNSIEAMKETGGVLMIRAGRGEGDQVLISVSDNGAGLPVERTDDIFNAFFTTKPQGSGMGLAISKSIVESHGGRLWATSNDGRGATFHFTLPNAG